MSPESQNLSVFTSHDIMAVTFGKQTAAMLVSQTNPVGVELFLKPSSH